MQEEVESRTVTLAISTTRMTAIVLKSAISKYERGERELPLRLAVRLAEFYGVSVDYLVGLTDEQRPYPRKKK